MKLGLRLLQDNTIVDFFGGHLSAIYRRFQCTYFHLSRGHEEPSTCSTTSSFYRILSEVEMSLAFLLAWLCQQSLLEPFIYMVKSSLMMSKLASPCCFSLLMCTTTALTLMCELLRTLI